MPVTPPPEQRREILHMSLCCNYFLLLLRQKTLFHCQREEERDMRQRQIRIQMNSAFRRRSSFHARPFGTAADFRIMFRSPDIQIEAGKNISVHFSRKERKDFFAEIDMKRIGE